MNKQELIDLLKHNQDRCVGTISFTTEQVIEWIERLEEPKPIKQEADLEKIDLLKNCQVDIAVALKDAICNIDATDIVDYSDVSFGITNGNEIEVEGLNLDEEELFDKIIRYLDDTIEESINSIKDEM
jgi:hypothetical protein